MATIYDKKVLRYDRLDEKKIKWNRASSVLLNTYVSVKRNLCQNFCNELLFA